MLSNIPDKGEPQLLLQLSSYFFLFLFDFLKSSGTCCDLFQMIHIHAQSHYTRYQNQQMHLAYKSGLLYQHQHTLAR